MQPRPNVLDVVRNALAAHRTQTLREEVKCPTSNRLAARVVLSEFKEQAEQCQGNCLWGVWERVHRDVTSGEDMQRVEDSRQPVGTRFPDTCSKLFRKEEVKASRVRERAAATSISDIIGNATESWRKARSINIRTFTLCDRMSQGGTIRHGS